MGMVDRQIIFSYEMAKLIIAMHDLGYGVRLGDAWRSTDPLTLPNSSTKASYQELLVINGKSKVKYGKHNDRLAIDLLLMMNGILAAEEEYRQFGVYWEGRGGVWGGRFGVKLADYPTKIGWDSNHFEWP